VGRPKAVTDEEILAKARACFLARGAGVTAQEIGRALGVSHTTLFNRFGSKEGLMLAALGIPDEIPWVADLQSGPDERPIAEQLSAHGKVIAAFFEDLHAGMAVLQAAGIPDEKVQPQRGGDAAPARAFGAFLDWLRRAQAQGRIGDCDVEALASTILGSLYHRGMTAGVCGHATTGEAREAHVDSLIELLWTGIGVPGHGTGTPRTTRRPR
jgi:AcrR family transcriptional regulator